MGITKKRMPKKDTVDKPLYNYQRMIFDALVYKMATLILPALNMLHVNNQT